MTDDTAARLRALAQAHRDAWAAHDAAVASGVNRRTGTLTAALLTIEPFEAACTSDALLALLDALDKAERERGSLRAVHDDMRGTILRFKAERDALAALLREAYRLLDTASDATQTFPMVSIGHWMDKANAALAAREGVR